MGQPLLVHYDKKNNNREVYLIPELCTFIGLTEQMKNMRRTYREVKLA